ncbi:MAG: LemA protein [Candidatus Atribacteria bacterium]|jgi:LemA protein|uniref:LemA family protein n=1 Tax=Atrimonas thermophila TaxID=3064161 RepID=UPI0024AA0D9F|nr:LemA protein [Candidatus Atribacteria bacterium]
MGWVVLAILVIVGLYLIVLYNRLITFRNRVENAWAQVDVQLRRRYDLIPNLVETVKGYAAHEREIFENVARSRQAAISAQSPQEKGQMENQLTQALRQLFAVAEAYPELRASENFQNLQAQLAETENKIAYARQFYNDTVFRYNTTIEKFPANLFARSLGFAKKEYFEVEGEGREPVRVAF